MVLSDEYLLHLFQVDLLTGQTGLAAKSCVIWIGAEHSLDDEGTIRKEWTI